jgi:CreA protein
MKLKIQHIILCILIILLFPIGSYCQTVVGEVDCVVRLLQGNDKIKIIRLDDPENPFISLFFTTIDTGQWFALADPSNTSIATRLTGEIPRDENGKQLVEKRTNLDVYILSKSIFSKEMKIARFYDEEKNTLVYLVYTTKYIDGSLKHSLSVVPLGK